MGIVQIPEGRQLFPSLTVMENLEMGAQFPRAKKGEDKRRWSGSSTLSTIAGEKESAGRDPQRRRAADACHREGIDVPAPIS